MALAGNGDGTVIDDRAGLVWQQGESPEQMDYVAAVAFCRDLRLGGYDDWRLPTKEELVGLAAAGFEPLREVKPGVFDFNPRPPAAGDESFRRHFPGLQLERYWAFAPPGDLSWADSPDRIAYTVEFDPDRSSYLHPTTYFRTYKYWVRAVRDSTAADSLENIKGTRPEARTPASESMLPNDALRGLRSRVEQLTADRPRRQDAILDPKLDQQLPWICRTLEEAASALESGLDPFGNPITNSQICSGLRTLTEMVRAPEYLTAMEIGHTGIAAPLERCMDQLEVIIGGIEAPATAGPSSSKGIGTLVALCTELGILYPDTHVKQAVEELREEGESGSRSLAVLVRELSACRSPKITHALHVAGQVVPVPELLDAVRAVAAASELTEAPAHGRFTPHIVGDGRVGWASGTYREVVGAALKAAAALESGD